MNESGDQAQATRTSDEGQSIAGRQKVFFLTILGLIQPNREVPVVAAHPVPVGEVSSWDEHERQLMLEEGRRQLDRQASEFDRIQSRAQQLFTVGLALSAAVAALLPTVHKAHCTWATVLWIASIAGTFIGVIGAASVMSVRADFETIDTAVLSNYERPIGPRLAADYAAMMRKGENTNASRLTVFRLAVVWIITGGLAGLLAWFVVKSPF
jgi:hypothetical protein